MSVLSNDEHAATFLYISMRSDKLASMMSGKEDGQGITVDKASLTSKIVRFFKGIVY